MDQDGVEGVYQGYYNTKFSLPLPFVPSWALDEVVDYGNEVIEAACNTFAPRCQFSDPREVMTDADISIDGIHPTESGSRKMADQIWLKLEPML
jgi:hypothetical protein